MKVHLKHFSNKKAIEDFLNKNDVTNYQINLINNEIELIIEDNNYSQKEIDVLKRHFSFFDIFFWSDDGIENVTLWEKPRRINDVLSEFENMFSVNNFDVITSIEARGFILGGIFTKEYSKPFVSIRKYKNIYDTIPGVKYKYINWKNEEETLYLFKHSIKGKKAIFIDDIMETGKSLKAAQEILKKQGIQIIGAFYLMDGSNKEIRNSFDFPIRSLLRFDNIFDNTRVK
jgi:adenine/guanine phosphoribosyltransferase-like PRPP-binding protein